jgi:hypothetical protein
MFSDVWVKGHTGFLLRQNSVWFGGVIVENEVDHSERPNMNNCHGSETIVNKPVHARHRGRPSGRLIFFIYNPENLFKNLVHLKPLVCIWIIGLDAK